MKPTIDEEDAQRLIERYDRSDEDPLDLRRRCRDTCAGVVRLCDDMLAGEATFPADIPISRLDATSAAILAHLGIHPGAAAAITEAARGLGIMHDPVTPTIQIYSTIEASGRPPCSIELPFDGLHWNGVRLLVTPLPATITSAVNSGDESPPLRTLVSHPALDPMDLCVLWMEDEGSGTAIVLNADDTPLTRDGLDAVWHERRRPA